MTRYTLTVPRVFNTGEAVPAGVVRDIERSLVDDFGGFTRTEGEGTWDGDRLYREPVTVYTVDTDRPGALDRLREQAEWIADVLDQEAVYVTAQPITTYLVSTAYASRPSGSRTCSTRRPST